MKKILSLMLTLTLAMTVIGVSSASAMYDASNNKETTHEYYRDVVTNVTYYGTPCNTTTRTANADGTMTIKSAYSLNNYYENGSSDIVKLSDGKMLTGAYFTMDNIKCENSDNMCDNQDGLFFSNGPVNVTFYTGPDNYSNHRTITKYDGYGIDNGQLMYQRYDGNITDIAKDDPVEAGVGCSPDTKTYALTEPGLYRIAQGTCHVGIAFMEGSYEYVCILDGTENMNDNIAKTATAIPHYSKVSMNGKSFNCPAYIIGGTNYIRIRDIAYMLNGTNKAFNVTYWDGQVGIWDGESNKGKGYEVLGTEFAKLKSGNKTASISKQSLTAESCVFFIKPVMYNIDGSNYVRLVDMARIMNFGIGYDASTSTVSINTSVGYSKLKRNFMRELHEMYND